MYTLHGPCSREFGRCLSNGVSSVVSFLIKNSTFEGIVAWSCPGRTYLLGKQHLAARCRCTKNKQPACCRSLWWALVMQAQIFCRWRIGRKALTPLGPALTAPWSCFGQPVSCCAQLWAYLAELDTPACSCMELRYGTKRSFRSPLISFDGCLGQPACVSILLCLHQLPNLVTRGSSAGNTPRATNCTAHSQMLDSPF